MVNENDTIVTPAVLAMIGKQGKPEQACEEMSKGDHRRYVLSIMSDLPLWHDQAAAKKTIYGANQSPAPQTLRAVNFLYRRALNTPDPIRNGEEDPRGDLSDENELRIPFPKGVASFHGGDEVEYFRMPSIGDRITVTRKVVNIVAKTGRSGKIAVAYVDVIHTNQKGEVLCITRASTIRR